MAFGLFLCELASGVRGWPLQDIRFRSLQRFREGANHHFIAPPPVMPTRYRCNIVLHDYRAKYAPLPILILYAIHHTVLVMAISCKGQVRGRVNPTKARIQPALCLVLGGVGRYTMHKKLPPVCLGKAAYRVHPSERACRRHATSAPLSCLG